MTPHLSDLLLDQLDCILESLLVAGAALEVLQDVLNSLDAGGVFADGRLNLTNLDGVAID